MAKPEGETNETKDDAMEPAVVYHRPEPEADEPRIRFRLAGTHGIAPAVTPLIVGFLLLLALISILGYLSVHKMEDVGHQVLDLEENHSARANLLLQLRLALTQLDNEARSRQQAEATRGILPPFELRLRTAREEVNRLLPQLDRPPLSQDPAWVQFRNDLDAYVKATEDLRRYSLEGFTRFTRASAELNELFKDSAREQSEIFQKSEKIQQQAARSIRVWSVLALLCGALVAAGTVWEVQRRFRQMQRSMNEARRERAFSTQMLEGMVSAVVAIDHHDRIRSANKAFFDIFPGASVGALVRERFASDDAMKMLDVATSALVEEGTYLGRWVCRIGSDGLEKSFDIYSAPLAIDGDRGLLVTLVDATEAAEAERVLRRNESLLAVGQATTQVAHEIKNPLGSIRLGVSMLRDSVVGDKEALRTIELVERGIKHLNKLVIDVTQFSRRKPLEREEVELNELVDTSLELIAERIKSKGAVIETNFAGTTLRGNWDEGQLKQVFANVIANAIDASPNHTPITITTELLSNDGMVPGLPGARRAARVTIADQGTGMDKATLDRIFEPFFSTKKRGTGLGLAIVKQIIDQHDGRISAASEPGKGARFTIDLPL